MTSNLHREALDVRALTFDIFGTVVDWRQGVAREVAEVLPGVEAGEFASSWRRLYQPAMEEVRSGRRPWVPLDTLHREMLDQLLESLGRPLDEEGRQRLTGAWHRLEPWPDAHQGLTLLRSRFVLATLSNGNFSLLAELVNHGRLPFDCVISVEQMSAYKPQAQVYRGACNLLGLAPSQVMMVAAHPDDLEAARSNGMRTAYIARPLEWGTPESFEEPLGGRFDRHARDLVDLAEQLGAVA